MINAYDMQNMAMNAAIDKALNEATYYGKNKNLLKMESILDEMLSKSHKDGAYVITDEFSQKLYEVSELIRDTFGFAHVSINSSFISLVPKYMFELGSTSGCTLVHSAIFKYAVKMVGGTKTEVIVLDRDHKGVRFEKGFTYGLRMFIGPQIFYKSNKGAQNDLTGGELLAIILHEIGHNFYIGPIREIGQDLICMATISDMTIIVRQLIEGFLVQDASDFIDYMLTPGMKKAITRIYEVIGVVTTNIASFKLIGMIFHAAFVCIMLLLKAYRLVISPIEIVCGVLAYDSEKYSDSFATAYGYGPELSTALIKISHNQFTFFTKNYSSNFVEGLMHLVMLPFLVISMLGDPHPNVAGRINNNYKYLEACAKDIKDPALKKEYMKNLADLKGVCDNARNYDGHDPIQLGVRFNMMIQNITKITDWKDVLSSLHPEFTKYKNLDF